jgi:hypothetical protein
MVQPIISPEVVADAIARWRERQKKDLEKYFAAYEEVMLKDLCRRQINDYVNRLGAFNLN